MKIYTKKGDFGQTSLFGGDRVPKSSTRIEAYGTVDELNSIIGWTLCDSMTAESKERLKTIQEHLFVLGADLATPESSKTRIDRVDEQEIEYLESAIDDMSESLPELKNFILPGGSPTGAKLHIARTICRRAERLAVLCMEKEEKISGLTLKYLNRLSDFLFVAARYENREADTPEETWKPSGKS